MEETLVDRSRRYSWQDPAPFLAALPRTGGLELLRAMAAGGLPEPPIAATLGFEEITFDSGRVTVSLRPGEHHLNPLGTVHGGVLATLLDTACGCAVHTTLDAGTGYTSLDLVTRFLRPVSPATGISGCPRSRYASTTTRKPHGTTTSTDWRTQAWCPT